MQQPCLQYAIYSILNKYNISSCNRQNTPIEKTRALLILPETEEFVFVKTKNIYMYQSKRVHIKSMDISEGTDRRTTTCMIRATTTVLQFRDGKDSKVSTTVQRKD